MNTDVITLNNYTVIKETASPNKPTTAICSVEEESIAFVFYGSGIVSVAADYHNHTTTLECSKGLATSFFCSEEVQFSHDVSQNQVLQSVSIFSSITHIKSLSKNLNKSGLKVLDNLINPKEDFVLGPKFMMNPDMHRAVQKIFSNTYSGATEKIFMESQVMELMAHYFGMFSNQHFKKGISRKDKERLYFAKEILANKLEQPPSLRELSRLIGLNEYKLKRGFKQLFGVPVYKHLQNTRLETAHNLLTSSEISVYQAALSVGYESLSSFSNAFLNKFGYRPSHIKSQPEISV